MTRYVSAVPAYGRDYKPGEEGEKDVRADWEAGKDFLTQDLVVHGYVNICDKPADVQLNIRYNKLQDICVIEADEETDEPGYHGKGELADFDPGTGRSSMDDWLK